MTPPILQKFGSDNFKGDTFLSALGLLYPFLRLPNKYLEVFFFVKIIGGQYG